MKQEIGLGLLQEQKQELEITQKLVAEHPFGFARDLHERSEKVKVPISLGRYSIFIDAAIVRGEDLGRIFEDERFAGMIASGGERYLFFNRELKVPDEARAVIPKLMAFHCLAAIKLPDFGDKSGNLKQFQAIALELAYAKTLFPPRRYEAYEAWRPTVERSPFFQREDWKEVVGGMRSEFRDAIEKLHRNAHKAEFAVMVHGETFRLELDGTATGRDGKIPVHRKARRPL